MEVRLHPHAIKRLEERGATKAEIIDTIKVGESFPAKFGRTGFRRNFPYQKMWRGKVYATKQIEAYAVRDGEDWMVITFIARYY